MSLTEEQEIFLQSLEKEFENRYTEMDEEFKAVFNAKPPTPPIYENYFERYDQRERYHDNRPHSYSGSYRDRSRYRGYGDYNSRDRYRRSYEDRNYMRDRSPVRFRSEREYREPSSRSTYESVDYSQDY